MLESKITCALLYSMIYLHLLLNEQNAYILYMKIKKNVLKNYFTMQYFKAILCEVGIDVFKKYIC